MPANDSRQQRLRKRVRFRRGPSTLPKGASDSFDAGSPSAQTGFRGDIEGLRAVAVLAVVLFHADVAGVGGGFVGVDVFFVISGFLITGLLWREVNSSGTVGLRHFYGARARRLLPASATVGVITLIASAVLLSPLQVRTVIYDGIASALYVGNMWFVYEKADYFSTRETPSPFQHYWSLGVEEQFYLVWPAADHRYGVAYPACASAHRRPSRVVGTALPRDPCPGRGGVICGLPGSYPRVASCGVLPHAHPGLAASRRWCGGSHGRPVAPTTGTAGRDRGMGRSGGDPARLHPVEHHHTLSGYRRTAARARHRAGDRRGRHRACPLGVGRVLALPPMRALGRVSYSWYLWHWPVLVLAAPLVGHPLGLTARLATVVISCGLAVLTLRFIENPLRFAPSVRRSGTRSLALGGVATAVAVCVGVALLVVDARPGRARPRGSRTDRDCGTRPHGLQHRCLRRGGAARIRPGTDRSRRIRRAKSRTVEPQPAPCRCGTRRCGLGTQRLHAQSFPSRTA